jgi:hypothetical protein
MTRHDLDLLAPRSHLFTVRLWSEALGGEQHEVRMQVRHVLSGETRYFRAWPALAAYMQAKMQEFDAESSSTESDLGGADE